MNIYVASSWRNEYQPTVVELLKVEGHDVYDFRNPPGRAGFGWGEIGDGWQSWNTSQYVNALAHPIAEAGFKADFDALRFADLCLWVAPCGVSAALELGYAVGAGIPTIAYIPNEMREPELMLKMADQIVTSWPDCIGAIEHATELRDLVYL